MPLTSRQERALAHVRALSAGGPVEPGWSVTLAFHPDRDAGGASVIGSIARDGLYRNQFETGTSNGGLTAHAEGDRWCWESAMFGGAYDDGPPEERPVYGALDLVGEPYGASPRFGSSFLRLRPEALRRSTSCYPDSVFEPTHVGVHDAVGSVVDTFRQHVPPDPLDHYVEVQVHGRVTVDDVAEVVLDPSFRGTAVEVAARGLAVPLGWTPGRELDPATGADEQRAYRGPDVHDLATELADGARVDARTVGEAAATGEHDPQRLKRVWHLVAQFGAPSR